MKICSVLTLMIVLSSAAVFAKNPVVVMDTTKGKIEIELFAKKSPISVQNFLTYVSEKYYDGLIFHRVIKGFMIQGGGFKPGMEEKFPTHKSIQNESKNGVSNTIGTIAMARLPSPHSASSQFFINTANNERLDGFEGRWGYAVFGKVIKGMDVVRAIEDASTGTVGPYADVPFDDIIIKSIRLKK